MTGMPSSWYWAKELNLASTMEHVVTGQALKQASLKKRADLVAKTSVSEQIEPTQKVDIVKALEQNDHDSYRPI